MFRAMRTRLVALLTFLAVAVAVPAAIAATKHGITPTAPKKNATVKAGSRPTFRGRVKGPGVVYVYVSKSAKKNKDGLIGHKEMIQQAKVSKGHFKVKANYFDYPTFWLNTPGTYYWQAHRINCGEGSDCNQEGPVVKFKVG
ncbi:MAG: hypothetical protein QOI80_766 [Solirubrobacteraceae bacterium]|jgi:hypothetical protein|nr:hypothetical protein [Solirubrobacteraceae bacterium]